MQRLSDTKKKYSTFCNRYYEFTFKGEKAILCHGVGHLCGLADAKTYGEQFEKWDLDKYPCIPEQYKVKANGQLGTYIYKLKEIAAKGFFKVKRYILGKWL